jgi:dimethylaniline monooxygenase (N-oxide forming)
MMISSTVETAKLPACVIGAGVSGLVTSQHLHEAGIAFDCFDERSSADGIWAITEETDITCAWESLHLNSPREMYTISDLPMPSTYSKFPKAREVWEYLNNYIDHFGFRDSMHFETRVDRISKSEDGNWDVSLSNGETKRYRAVVVANGHHNTPRTPDYPGSFGGEVIHSRNYRSHSPYAGKRVLVVGLGNSGSQIATDVSETAERVYLSTRRGVWVIPHFVHGRSFNVWFPMMPWWVMKPAPVLFHRVMSLYYKLILGSPAKHGMPEPDHDLGTALPTVCSDLYPRLESGDIVMKPPVSRLENDSVRFADDTVESVDAIIYCTGYETTFPFLDEDIFNAEDNVIKLYKRTFLPSDPSLSFVGASQGIGHSFTQMYEAQAELVAAHLSGTYALPSQAEMLRNIKHDIARTRREFHRTPRNNYQVYGPLFIHECKTELRRGRERAQHVDALTGTL